MVAEAPGDGDIAFQEEIRDEMAGVCSPEVSPSNEKELVDWCKANLGGLAQIAHKLNDKKRTIKRRRAESEINSFIESVQASITTLSNCFRELASPNASAETLSKLMAEADDIGQDWNPDFAWSPAACTKHFKVLALTRVKYAQWDELATLFTKSDVAESLRNFDAAWLC